MYGASCDLGPHALGVLDESLGVRVAASLLRQGVKVFWHDPLAEFAPGDRFEHHQNAVTGAEAVLVALPLAEYRGLNYTGRFVVDVWGVVPPALNVCQLGVGLDPKDLP